MCTILSSSNIITRDKSKAVKKGVPRHLFLPTRMEYIRMQRHLRIMVLVVQKSSLYSTASRNNYRSPAFKNRFSSSRLSRPSPFFSNRFETRLKLGGPFGPREGREGGRKEERRARELVVFAREYFSNCRRQNVLPNIDRKRKQVAKYIRLDIAARLFAAFVCFYSGQFLQLKHRFVWTEQTVILSEKLGKIIKRSEAKFWK